MRWWRTRQRHCLGSANEAVFQRRDALSGSNRRLDLETMPVALVANLHAIGRPGRPKSLNRFDNRFGMISRGRGPGWQPVLQSGSDRLARGARGYREADGRVRSRGSPRQRVSSSGTSPPLSGWTAQECLAVVTATPAGTDSMGASVVNSMRAIGPTVAASSLVIRRSHPGASSWRSRSS